MSTTPGPDHPVQHADAERIRRAIGYGPVMVSGHTGGVKWGGLTYRTAQDVDDLVQRLLPVLAQVRAEAARDARIGR